MPEKQQIDLEQQLISQTIVEELKSVAESPDWLRELIQVFHSQVGDHLKHLMEALERKDEAVCFDLLHTLKSSIHQIGGIQLGYTVLEVERLVMAGRAQEAQQAGKKIGPIFEQTESALRNAFFDQDLT